MSPTPAGFVSVAMPVAIGVAMGRRHSFTASRRGADHKRATSVLVGPSSRSVLSFAARLPMRRFSGTSLRAYGRDMEDGANKSLKDKKGTKDEEYKAAKQKAKMEAKAEKEQAKMEARAEKEKIEAKAAKEQAKMEAKAEKEKEKMEAAQEQAKMEAKAEKEQAKMEAKAAKEQAKMEEKAEKMEEKAEMSTSTVEEAPVFAVEAMQELLEFQRQVHADERDNWRAEREAQSIREERLLDMVDTLSGRLAEVATAVVEAPSTPAAAEAPAPAPVQPPPSTAAPQQPPAQPESPPGVPEPVLGGRGILDVLDAVEEVNNRFRADRSFDPVEVEEVKSEAAPAAAAAPPSPSPPTPPPSTAKAEQEKSAEALEVEVVDTDKGQPPELKYGSDDIYWVNQLQAALLREGMYCGEEEMEEWYFGHHTQESLMTLQAMKGFPETGVCDMQTWEALLGPGFRAVTKDEMPFEVRDSVDDDLEAGAADAAAGAGGADDMFAFLKDGEAKSNGSKAESNGSEAPPTTTSAEAPSSNGNGSAAKAATFTKWPVVRLDDGGAAVHHLQVALETAGYACDDDEMRWWMYGDTTQMSVEIFQACNDLTETGIVDEHTWKKLLDNPDATPDDISSLVSGDSYDEDLSMVGDATEGGGSRVWLVGEQRWSNPITE